MTDYPLSQIDRQQSSEWPYPAWENLPNVKDIKSTKGRNAERGNFQSGSESVTFEVEAGNSDFASDYDNDPVVLNGFSRACSDYLSTLENSLVIYSGALMTYEGPVGVGKLQFLMQTSTSSHEWRIGNDIEYYGEVTEYLDYVVSLAVQETTGLISSYPLAAKVHWFTETGAYISSTTWRSASTTVNVETRVHAKVTAPAGAAYATLGATSSANVTGTAPHIRFSKFMIHAYDAAYELANGTMLKPFAVDDLYDYAPDVSPKRTVIPGNQFKIADLPQGTIGSDPPLRQMSTLNLGPTLYSMDTMTSGNIASYFTTNRVNISVINTDFFDGTQCIRAQTVAGAGPDRLLLFSPNSSLFNVPVVPTYNYSFKFRLKNKAVGSATFDVWVNDSAGGFTKIVAAQVIAGSSGWNTYTASYTAPASAYGVYMYIIFAANSYDIYVDKYEVFQVNTGTEPARTDNALAQWGTFESTSSMALNAITSISSAGANFKHVIDNSAGAPSGMKFISLDKPLASTQESIRFSKTSDIVNVWVEPGRDYQLSYYAKKTNANTTNMQEIYRYNDAANGASFNTFTAHAVTTTWTKYTQTITVPATASGLTFALRVQGSSSDACQVYIDNVSITRVPVEMASTSTIDEANLTRTTYYDVDSPATDTQMHIMWGYANYEDVSVLDRVQHSGKTQTRFKQTLGYAGIDLSAYPAYWVPIGTTGRSRNNDDGTHAVGVRGIPAWDLAVTATLPTAGSPTVSVDLLAPNIPFRAWTWSLMIVLPKGSRRIGFTHTNEYIGPDGYQSAPGVYEDVRFVGNIVKRSDPVDNMAIAGERTFDVNLESVDINGIMEGIKLSTPHQSAVLKDKPIAYMPFNQDDLSELSGRLMRTPEYITAGDPSGWGVEYDGDTTLAGVSANEGGSFKFTGSGSLLSGQMVKLTDPSLKASPGVGFSMGAMFKHELPITSPTECIFGQVRAGVGDVGGIYAYLTGTGLNAGVQSGVLVTSFPDLDIDGQVHQVFVTTDGVTAKIYLDGALVGSHAIVRHEFDTTYIGGNWIDGGFKNMFNGWIGHVAMYDYALTATQVQDQWLSASRTRDGEDEVDRLKHVLSLAGQATIPVTVKDRDGNTPVGVEAMGSPSWTSGTSLREALASTATSAGGQFFVGNNGDLIYENRRQRFNYGGSSNQSWLIGVGSDIQPEFSAGVTVGPDLTKIINDATITVRNVDADENGIQRALNRKSIRRFNVVPYSDTVDLQNPEDARYIAEWLVNTNDKPYPRFEKLVFKYEASDDTAEFCRKVRISDYIHGDLGISNGLNGGLISGFVESIEEDIKMLGGAMSWETTILVSPANNQLVAVLDDSTYGILNAGYKLAY